MNKQDIRNEAKAIFRNDKKNLLIAGGIYAILLSVTQSMDAGFTSTLFATLIGEFITASSVSFYFFAFQNRKSDFRDMYELFTNAKRLNNTISVIIFLCLVDLIFIVAERISLFIPFLSIFVLIANIIVHYSLILVLYLYVANPDYPLNYYAKASQKLISMEYIWFAISVLALPFFATLILSMFIPVGIASLICYPLTVFANLAIAGFADTFIPDSWYDGNYRI